jgi:hypothetical protein
VIDEPRLDLANFMREPPVPASLERLRRDRRERSKVCANAPAKIDEAREARHRDTAIDISAAAGRSDKAIHH